MYINYTSIEFLKKIKKLERVSHPPLQIEEKMLVDMQVHDLKKKISDRYEVSGQSTDPPLGRDREAAGRQGLNNCLLDSDAL